MKLAALSWEAFRDSLGENSHENSFAKYTFSQDALQEILWGKIEEKFGESITAVITVWGVQI